MKAFLAVVVFALSSSAFASKFTKEQYTCKQIKMDDRVKALTHKLVLTSTSRANVEGKPIRYVLQVFDRGNLIVSEEAIGMKEDVILNFAVKSKSISGTIYMDELNQTVLSVNGKKLNFDCDVKF